MKDFVDTAHMVKTVSEFKNLNTSCEFTNWTFTKIIREVESILKNSACTKHSSIQEKIESCLDQDEAMAPFLENNPGLNKSFLDYATPVLIQSGKKFTLNEF